MAPLAQPYPDSIAKILDTYPQGPEGPIRLFRTLARSERILKKIGSAGLLDKESPLSIKEREILILRTSFNTYCDYEWGIHVATFSKRAKFSEAQIKNTSQDVPNSALWSVSELLLFTVADELSNLSDLRDNTWRDLELIYSEEQILEIITLVGFYHMIAFLNNSLRVAQEDNTPSFSNG